MERHRRREVRGPTMVTPSCSTTSPGMRQLAVTAGLGREVDDHRAGPHALDCARGDELRRRPARNGGGRDHDVEVGDPLLERGLLLRLLLGRELRRVAARRSPRVRTPRSRKARAEALTCSATAGRTSNAETTAPSRRAVAIAWRPATPAPITSTRAGAIVPAAVISIGKRRRHAVGCEERRPCSRRPWPATRARPSTARV